MKIAGIYRYFIIVCVCTAIGAVSNLLLILLIAFLFAGSEGESWLKWYFEFGNGLLFFFISVLLGTLSFPYIKHLKLSHA